MSGSQTSMSGPGGSNSRIEVSTVQQGEDQQSGNLTVYGAGNYNIRATISREGTNCQIVDEQGQARNINVDNPPQQGGPQPKVEKRVIFENGVETVEEYVNDVLVKRTVNGVSQPIQ
ncbi:uncharacterized protein LOC144169563 [Haemaphysalis longicornis]